ncbi:hypothetical protein JMN32_06450 [Fulvivirga sp. 29W222]|uniref:G-D-S-L family lipolytic protein n=1 Tax=Fulvivirga marina TaxID=2494733 RepID=A0A937KDD7_9BACT|nr:hypothetical protein [Fulvivirga marina]MBL6445940.1 hypothetical protein [Fulvivirga marina]
MKNFKKYIGLSLSVALLWSCTYDAPEQVEPNSGTADFSKVVAVGNSLTAGFMNGALYDAGQSTSYAAILSTQMQLVGGGTFNTPMTGSTVGCYNPSEGCTAGRLVLKGLEDPTPSPTVPGDPNALAPYGGDKGALNNFGVPGITLATALTPLAGAPADPANPAFNPYYARIASNPGTSTIIGDATTAFADGATFLLFWLGSNDVLGYAIGGAANEAILTSEGDFETRFNGALGSLLQANTSAKGAVANIPNVLSVPFFKLVPWNAIPLDAATAAFANSSYQDYNDGLAAALALGEIDQAEHDRRLVEFVEGQNGFIVEDDELTTADISAAYGFPPGSVVLPNYRHAESTDLVPLTAGSVLGTLQDPNDPTSVYGVGVAMGDQYLLTPAELSVIQSRTAVFNQTIANTVTANSDRLVLIDIHSILEDLAENGTVINGSTLNASVTPPFGGFSLDGVHPNSRGNAFIANKFIEAINAKFNALIPFANPNDYAGNALPIP